MGCTVSGMTEIGTDWRVVDGVATAWFDAPSLIEGAALAGRMREAIDLHISAPEWRVEAGKRAND